MPSANAITLTASFDRASIRKLVEQLNAETARATERGENAYQVNLDQQDQLDAFAATLSEEEATRFYILVAEEMNALASRMMDQVAVHEAKEAQLAIPRAIGSVVTAAAILWILYMLIFMW